MGQVFEKFDDKLTSWIAQQHVFFVATAPMSEDGLINCSPKGLDSFRILNESTVAYLDLTGSGIETVAHLKQNSRIVIMFCGFEGPPKIVRIHGKGKVHESGSEKFENLIGLFDEHVGARSIIEVEAQRISDSCGYAVPLMKFESKRETLEKYAIAKGPKKLAEYRAEKNSFSLDGLRGLSGSDENHG